MSAPGAGGVGEGLPRGYPFKPDWEVTPRQAAGWLAARVGESGGTGGGGLLLDCRREDEWAVAKVAGAVLFPMDQVTARADEIEEEAGGKDRPIIVMCHHGRRSMVVTATLRGLGFTDVKSMAGGIDLWSQVIDPGVPRY